MHRLKRRTFSGVVCEQEVYTVNTLRNYKAAQPRPRFKTEEERKAHKEGISRRKHERLVNANFRPTSYYVTLTFDMDNEVHDYTECRILMKRYIRRLQYKYPGAVIFSYMGRGEHTNRFHLHLLIEGIPSEYIAAKWTYGDVKRVDRLRAHNFYDGIDHGADYTALANYLFDHWEPEQGPHRYHHTRNAVKPEREDARICYRNYTEDKTPVAPRGYKLVDIRATKYGYLYYKYILDPDIQYLRE